jgi:hypothetical protein
VIRVLNVYAQFFARHKLIVAVVLASAAGVVLTSKDFLFTPVAAATLAGVLTVALQRMWQHRALAELKQARTVQLLSVAAIPVLFSVGLRVNADHAFREAFGVAVPAGVRELTVDSNVSTPSGRRAVLMRFVADSRTVRELLAGGGFEADQQIAEARNEHETWSNILRLAFGDMARLGGAAWTKMSPMPRPEYRRWLRTLDGTRTETSLLWDADTGQAYLLYRVS